MSRLSLIVNYVLDRYTYEVDEYGVWQEMLDSDVEEQCAIGFWKLEDSDVNGDYLRGLMNGVFREHVGNSDPFEIRLSDCFVVEKIEEIDGAEFLYDYEMRLSIRLEDGAGSAEKTAYWLNELGLI